MPDKFMDCDRYPDMLQQINFNNVLITTETNVYSRQLSAGSNILLYHDALLGFLGQHPENGGKELEV